MSILVTSRRRHFKIRDNFIRKLYPNENIIHCSDEKGLSGGEIDSIWWNDYKSSQMIKLNIEISYVDIIKRCRFLRELKNEKSISLINDAIYKWNNIITQEKIDLIYCLPIDSYVFHTLYLVANKRKIHFFSTVGTLFNNRIRITNFGELVFNSNYSSNNDFIKLFINNVRERAIRPEWLIGVNSSPFKTSLKRYFIDVLKPPFFWLYRQISKDHNSFSFPNKKLYKKRMFSSFKRFLWANKVEKNAVKIKDVKYDYIFIPLQFYPEITSDYWNKDISLINHHEMVLNIIKKISNKLFIVKEHPASFGKRDESFLKELTKCKNVKFASLLSDINIWLTKAEIIIGNSSTTTINAIILKKPVLFFSKPYFGTKKK